MNHCIKCKYYRKVEPFGKPKIEYCIKTESMYVDSKKCDSRLLEPKKNG